MSHSLTIVVQARMGSSRLPGKMLMPLNDNKSLLYWLIERIRKNKITNHIVVATSDLAQDDALEEECQKLGVPCYRGSEWDVLDRFYRASLIFEDDLIMRICGDSPLISGEIIEFAMEQFIDKQVDYFSNGNEPPLYAEDGFCVELFSKKNLEEAFKKSEWMSEREHVTPYIKKNPNLRKHWQQFREHYKYKLSVDTTEDYNLTSWIFAQMTDPYSSGMDEVLKIMERNPDKFNSSVVLNEGYKKSIMQDRKIK